MAVTELQPDAGGVAGRPMEWLEAEILTLAGHIAAAECRFLLLVGEYDRRGGWESWACLSCAHWLSWRCGISDRTAREHVRVGRALEELPVMRAAFAAGQLSYSKVRAMTRVATPKSEHDLVEVAKRATASHIDRIVAGYRQVKRNLDPDRGRAQLCRRGVWYETNDDGTVTITIRGGPDSIAVVKQAIEAALPEVPRPIDQPDSLRAAHHFDALEHVARVYLAPDEHAAPRTEVVVHADLEPSPKTNRAAASSKTAPDSVARPCSASRATAGCGSRSMNGARPSTSAGAAGPSRRRCAGRSSTAIRASAGSRAAR